MNNFVIGALALVGAVLVLGLAWGASILAIPLAIAAVAVFGLTTFHRRTTSGPGHFTNTQRGDRNGNARS